MRAFYRALPGGRVSATRHEKRFHPLHYTGALPRFLFMIIGLAAGEINVLWGLACFALAVASPLERHLYRRIPRVVVALAALCALLLAGQSAPQLSQLAGQLARLPSHTPFHNDAVAMTSCATALLVAGYNPYTEVNIYRCFWQSGYYRTGSLLTPLQQGSFKNVTTYPSRALLDSQLRQIGLSKKGRPVEFEWRFSYPAGAFLLPALAWRFGLTDLRLFELLCFLAAYAFLVWWAPRVLWSWIGLLGLINAAVWGMAASGASDALYTVCLLVAWCLRRQGLASAIALGLAVTARQQAWFFVPFYAILVWQEAGGREVWRRGGIVAAIFALTNLPFIILSPVAWALGIVSPIIDPMFPRGVGLISIWLSLVPMVPLPPRWLFWVVEILAFGGCLALYWRLCRRWPHLGLLLAVIPLFFAWRSLSSYFYPVSVLVLGAVVDLARAQPEGGSLAWRTGQTTRRIAGSARRAAPMSWLRRTESLPRGAQRVR